MTKEETLEAILVAAATFVGLAMIFTGNKK
jgi:hypothetical protein